MGGGEGDNEGDDERVKGSVTSLNTVPSNCRNAWLALQHRGIEAVFVERSHALERQDAPAELLAACLKRDDDVGGSSPATKSRGLRRRGRNRATIAEMEGHLNQALAKAMDATHKNEEQFSRELFDAVVATFGSPGGGWRVHRTPSNKRRRVVQQVPQKGKAAKGQIEYHFDDMILLGREGKKVSRGRAAAKKPSPPEAVAAADAAASAHSQSGPPRERRVAEENVSTCFGGGGGGRDGEGEVVVLDDDVKLVPRVPAAAAVAASPARSSDRRLRKRKEVQDPSPGAAAKKPRRFTSPDPASGPAPSDRPRKRKGAPAARANLFVRRVGDTLYAMGLSRKVKMRDPEGLSIIEGESFPDHAWIIYEKKVGTKCDEGREDNDWDDDNEGAGVDVDDYDESDLEGGGEWIVHRLLASVELKTEQTSGKHFDMKNALVQRRREGSTEEMEEEIFGVDPTGNVSENGPLAQELAYVVGHALPGLVGLGLDLPERVPFAVVAGKCSESPQLEAIRWLHGNITTPDECGGGFYYSVDAFETFRGEHSGRNALAAYLDVMRCGLSAGEKWLANRNHQVLAPKALCGRVVTFGGVPLHEVSLKYSPLNMDKGQVSQGEIFGGNVNLTQLRRAIPDGDSVTWCRVASGAEFSQSVGSSQVSSKSDTPEPIEHGQQAERSLLPCSPRLGESSRPAGTAAASSPAGASNLATSSDPADSSEPAEGRPPAGCTRPVLVKVVSRACFGKLVGLEGLLWHHSDSVAFRSLLGYLSPSLHAVHTVSDEEGTERGLVQLMPDLSGTFEPLRPDLHLGDADQKKKMWTAFANLVKGTLIPLAEAKVVHLDLRPGCNRTANILYNAEKGEMRVIDLDSLILFGKWTIPVKHSRYLNKIVHVSLPSLRTALEFLFFQVIVITDAWSRRISDGTANAAEIAVSNEMVRRWVARTPRVACDGPFILERLTDIGVGFGVPREPYQKRSR